MLSKKTPNWLKILLRILFGWVSFMLSMIFLIAIIFLTQKLFNDFEIQGVLAIIILICIVAISVYFAFRVNKWQEKFLDKKGIITNYLILVILILITILTLPAPMVYYSF